MNNSVFDRVAPDYERIHNQSLPPGVSSDEFVRQKAEKIVQWIRQEYVPGQEFHYLDYGCGNGRLFKYMMESELLPLIEQERVRLFGFDTSMQSLAEAEKIVGSGSVRLVSDLNDLPHDLRFDLVVCCNVFHHIVPDERPTAARSLRRWMKPGARVVLWEHNPYNPLTRVLVKLCPFDEHASLLPLGMVIRLFSEHSYLCSAHEYVNIFPPRWHRFKSVSFIEGKLRGLPVGTQYWVMFETT